MSQTGRERWTLTIVLLSALAIGLFIGGAPAPVKSLAYLTGGALLLPLATVRVILQAVSYFKAKKIIAGALWVLASAMCGFLSIVLVWQFLNHLQK